MDTDADTLLFWETDFGSIPIPDDIAAKAKIRRDGLLDRRCKTTPEVYEWVERQTEKQRRDMGL